MAKTPFPLIPKNIGSVTYEHCIVQRLGNNIFIGDAERNYYVDRWHEINLCVHFSFRVPGTIQFSPRVPILCNGWKAISNTALELGQPR